MYSFFSGSLVASHLNDAKKLYSTLFDLMATVETHVSGHWNNDHGLLLIWDASISTSKEDGYESSMSCHVALARIGMLPFGLNVLNAPSVCRERIAVSVAEYGGKERINILLNGQLCTDINDSANPEKLKTVAEMTALIFEGLKKEHVQD
jgi:hypothetical protein